MGRHIPLISSLCGSWSKKSSKSSSRKDSNKKSEEEFTTEIISNNSPPLSPSQQQTTNNNYGENNNNDEGVDELINKPLPPPPMATKLEFGEPNMLGNKKLRKQTSNIVDKSSSLQNYLSKGSTRRILSSSMSMKLPTKFKGKANDFKDKAHDFKDKAHDLKDKASDLSHLKKKNEHESLWTKRIILGGKCKLPNNNLDDNEVINNNEQEATSDVGSSNNPTFDSKTTQGLSSRVYSRSLSCIDRETISSVDEQDDDDDKLVLGKGKGKEKVNSDS